MATIKKIFSSNKNESIKSIIKKEEAKEKGMYRKCEGFSNELIKKLGLSQDDLEKMEDYNIRYEVLDKYVIVCEYRIHGRWHHILEVIPKEFESVGWSNMQQIYFKEDGWHYKAKGTGATILPPKGIREAILKSL